jgi:DNA-binding response OmpR family regulator
MKLGADAYVTKPSNLDSLRERLQYAEEHREAVNRGETGRSSDQKPPEGVVDLGEITRDLIQQQMSAFEEATSTPSEEDQPPPRRRWPWSKRS